MRDIFYKNRTSADNRRKIIASSETSDARGVHSVVRRHFVYIVKEAEQGKRVEKAAPSIHILRERNTKEHRERYTCKVKGSIYVMKNQKLFLVIFLHSLSIELTALTVPGLAVN